jgi:hypothetical protein
MRDVLFLAAVIGFFVVSVLFVRACALVIGSPETSERERVR